MYALLYCSSASGPLSVVDLSGIAAAAAERNSLWGVTGLLLYGQGPVTSRLATGPPPSGFVQWIEGERETVQDLYAHIQADPRHTDFSVIARGEHLAAPTVAGRLFPHWKLRICPTEALPRTLASFLRLAVSVRTDDVQTVSAER